MKEHADTYLASRNPELVMTGCCHDFDASLEESHGSNLMTSVEVQNLVERNAYNDQDLK